jgi:hypothetical protein
MKTNITKYGEIRTPACNQIDHRSVRVPARPPSDSEGLIGEALGALLSIVAVISPIIILYFYYTRMRYRPVLLLHEESFVMYICFGLVFITLISIIGIAILYAILFGVYTVLGGHDFRGELLELSESALGISLVRLILIPGVVIVSIGANFFLSVEIFFGFFPKIPWMIGPFAPLIIAALAALIVHIANQ